jgi:hypothetical protein
VLHSERLERFSKRPTFRGPTPWKKLQPLSSSLHEWNSWSSLWVNWQFGFLFCFALKLSCIQHNIHLLNNNEHTRLESRGSSEKRRFWLSGIHLNIEENSSVWRSGHGLPTFTRKNLTTCQQDAFATDLLQASEQVVTNAVILSSCYKVVTHNLLTNCWIAGRWQVVGITCNRSVEFENLVASCQQAVGEHILLTSCWNGIAPGLLQLVRFHVCTGNISRKLVCQPSRNIGWKCLFLAWLGLKFLPA